MSRTHITCTINGDEAEFLCDANESLLDALRDEVGLMGAKAKDAIPALIEALKDKEWNVRLRAAEALKKIGPKAESAVPALIEALNDEDVHVSAIVKEALVSIQQQPQ